MRLDRALAALLALLASTAQAAPFLVSDPWPASGAQPSHCLYQEGTASVVEVPATVDATGTWCKWDMGAITRTAHSYQVWARNVWGESSKVPFAFSAVGAAAPTGLRLTP